MKAYNSPANHMCHTPSFFLLEIPMQKLFTFAAVAVFTLAFVGCEKKAETPATPAAPKVEVKADAPATPAVPATPAAPAVEKK